MQLANLASAGSAYRHVYVSPHFDDLALSLGGTALLNARRGEPSLVVTVFTAGPDAGLTGFAAQQHASWGGGDDPWLAREAEERAAMAALGVDYLWLGYPDAIYRGDQYLSDDDLFGAVKSGDAALCRRLADDLVALARRCPSAAFYLPLGVGNHVDHQLCLASAPSLVGAGARVALYEDSPYALSPGAVEARLAGPNSPAPFHTGEGEVLGPIETRVRCEIVAIGGLIADKVRLVELYASQVPWIFRDIGPAGPAIREYAARLSAAPSGFAERLWLLLDGGVS